MRDIEKAIKFFRNLINGVPKSNLLFGKPKDYENQMQLLAIQALQEEQERDKGCEFCKSYEGKESFDKEGYIFYAGYSKQIDVDAFDEEETEKINYCPICGRKLDKENQCER